MYQFKSGAEYLSKEYQKSFSAGKEIKDRNTGVELIDGVTLPSCGHNDSKAFQVIILCHSFEEAGSYRSSEAL